MASFVLTASARYPASTTVYVYTADKAKLGQAPSGSSVTSGTMGNSSIRFQGLSDYQDYVAYAVVNSLHVYTSFKAQPDEERVWSDRGRIETLEERIQYLPQLTVNVKDHGAVGDGVTDDTQAITDARFAAKLLDAEMFFPASSGEYMILAPIPYNVAMRGGGTGAVIKAKTGFVGAMMVDFEAYGNSLHIRDLTFDTGSIAGVGHFGTSDPSGSKGTYRSDFVGLFFQNSAAGVYSVGATGATGAGMLTGCHFHRCYWDNCAQVLNVGINQDDVLFSECRFHTYDTRKATTGYPYSLQGINIHFHSCYWFIGEQTFTISTLKPVFLIGSNPVVIDGGFMETSVAVGASTDADYLFYVAQPSSNFTFQNVYLNLPDASSLVALARTQITSTAGQHRITIKNITKQDVLTYLPIDVFIDGTATTGQLVYNFSGIEAFSAIGQTASGSTTTSQLDPVRTHGIAPNGIVHDAGGRRQKTTSAGLTGVAAVQDTFRLPGEGHWLVSVSALVNGSLDHAMTAAHLVVWQDNPTNDELFIVRIGSTTGLSRSTGSSILSTTSDMVIAAPTAAGDLVGVPTWTTGGSYALTWIWEARRLSSEKTWAS